MINKDLKNNFKKLLFISFIFIITITHYSCEDDPILEPNSTDEEYYGSSYGGLINNQKFNSSAQNPLIF
tara:strand:+ start:201 stop:407 length:207 start_codon:yes stop_codon:yes gene_type:complete